MLQITSVEPNNIDVNLWPAEKYVMRIHIKDDHLCDTNVLKKDN